ncbi:hypothetical protein [Nonomuraea cavernae]|uniref:Ig-like domain-containing protein n=1 Tax=Nonomuraea cavernae TaxID=2045107 RepID=A0A918DGN6_9ACTN|nr:hypothetical protein [Nonomuraea cavernae]MCA2185171.1 hypothetical protein [Nonomuraea cavernae]GGO65629.1 hypothetical protein GCM10012289_17770 [Nonomuraea cavernae]
MDNARNGIAGFRLTEHTWITEVGNWIDAISPDGRRAGALLFDPRVIGSPGVRDRVVAAVMTDQRLVLGGLSGLIPVADVVAAGDQVWLLTAQAVSPTLFDLLSSGSIDPGGAAAVLLETAQTLLALHASGLTHGSVHPRTVVIASDGAALLSERGLSDAIRAQVSPPERDAAAWASLARGLAASTHGAPRAQDLFERAAVTATTRGLTAARDVLVAGREVLPGGAISRDRLAHAARGQSVFAQAPPQALPQALPRDEGDIVTLLHVPGASSGSSESSGLSGPGSYGSGAYGSGAYGSGGSDSAAYGSGSHGSGSHGSGAYGSGGQVQFGPGVGSGGGAGFGGGADTGPGGGTREPQPGTTAERIWRTGKDEQATVQRRDRTSRASRARRRRTILAAAVFAAILAGAILGWLRLSDGPELAVVAVDVVAPKKTQGCGSVVPITGTIVTNGAPGEVHYEWRRNLDKRVEKGTLRTTSDRTSYEVSLRWSLDGKSTVKATATLRVLSPAPVITEKASFTYKC